jgi:hypothetical protein
MCGYETCLIMREPSVSPTANPMNLRAISNNRKQLSRTQRMAPIGESRRAGAWRLLRISWGTATLCSFGAPAAVDAGGAGTYV